MIDTKVDIAGVKWKNPVGTASGTFGFGTEFADFFDLSILGSMTTKGVSNVPWEGNPTPRIAETSSGVLNAIGLQNPGVDVFIERDLPEIAAYDTNVVVNVCGHTVPEYLEVVEKLSDQEAVDMLEINVSCPNVKEGGMAFGTTVEGITEITKEVKKVSGKPVIMKLSPNVGDITEIARAAEAAGADALSMINTFLAMKIDIYTRRPFLANGTGGLSGPAIHPIAVRMVRDVYKSVDIPIIAMGGVMTGYEAIEFMLAGATAVSVGVANFRYPKVTKQVIKEIGEYMEQQGIEHVTDIVGGLIED